MVNVFKSFYECGPGFSEIRAGEKEIISVSIQ